MNRISFCEAPFYYMVERHYFCGNIYLCLWRSKKHFLRSSKVSQGNVFSVLHAWYYLQHAYVNPLSTTNCYGSVRTATTDYKNHIFFIGKTIYDRSEIKKGSKKMNNKIQNLF